MSGTWHCIWDDVLNDPDIPDSAFRLALWLAARPPVDGGWVIHPKHVQRELRRSEHWVKSALGWLRKNGWIGVTAVRGEDGVFVRRESRLVAERVNRESVVKPQIAATGAESAPQDLTCEDGASSQVRSTDRENQRVDIRPTSYKRPVVSTDEDQHNRARRRTRDEMKILVEIERRLDCSLADAEKVLGALAERAGGPIRSTAYLRMMSDEQLYRAGFGDPNNTFETVAWECPTVDQAWPQEDQAWPVEEIDEAAYWDWMYGRTAEYQPRLREPA